MIERKDTPAPLMQRRPPPPLDMRPPMKHTSYSDSPPHTPPHRIRARGQYAAKAHTNQPTPRETYLNGLRDGDYARGGGEEHRNERVSHDLSLSDVNRHSVVDHMLLSLNPDQLKLFSTPPEDRPFSAKSRFTPAKGAHRRGHTQSSSLNTDFAYPSDESPLRSSGQVTRGRRSNSSSNFQSALGRIDSIQGGEDTLDRARAAAYQAQRAATNDKATGSTLRKGRKSNKSSGSSSVDLGNFMGQPRWHPTMSRRSSSFDHSNQGAYNLSLIPTKNSQTSHNVSQPIHYNISDAAPTPTVPVGPRSSDRSPVFPPQPAHPPPLAPPVRRNSNKSSTNQNNRRNKGRDRNRDAPALNGKGIADTRRESQEIPSIPAFIISRDASPAPRQQSTMGLKQAPGPQVIEPPRERPGFFRRVFGSSRNASLPASDVHATQLLSSANSIRTDSRGGFSSPHKLSKPHPNEVAAHPPKENAPPLSKKPSSFFRRRKKSISEHDATPFLPLHTQPLFKTDRVETPTDQEVESSPISSLRQVMNPFLKNTVPSQALGEGPHVSARGRQSSVSSTSNTAPRPLTGDRVLSSRESELGDHGSSVSRGHHQHVHSLARESPKSKAKLNPHDSPSQPRSQPQSKSKSKVRPQPQESFLLDSSSTENRMIRTSENAKLAHSDPTPLAKAPTSHPVANKSVDENQKPVTTSKQTVNHPAQQRPAESTTSPQLKPQLTRGSKVPTLSTSTTPIKNTGVKDRLPETRFTPHRKTLSPPGSSGKLNKVGLEPAGSHENLWKLNDPELPLEAAPVSPVSDYHSASSVLPTAKASDPEANRTISSNIVIDEPVPDADATIPTADDRTHAKQIYDGDESFVAKAKAAGWLGEAQPDRARVRQAYMELFDWKNLNILASLRDFCSRLLLKGETQQVDRILDAFSSRWCICNPNHGFKAKDVVHTICYSILLLNTDLHMADIEQKMTRAQFIKNTLPTVRRVTTDAAPDDFETPYASTLPFARPRPRPSLDRDYSPPFPSEPQSARRSFEITRPSIRVLTRPADQSGAALSSSGPPTPLDYETPTDDCGPLVKSPFRGKMSTWELQVEIVLKDFFNSIRQQRLPLHGNDGKENSAEQPMYLNSLSAITGNVLRRTPSMLSKAGSEHLSYRGRPLEHRLGTGRWTSKTRSRPRVYPASTVGSSRTSLEDQSSIWSPSVSSTWSKYSLGKTQTSLSMDSFGSSFPQADYHKSIGFANALSQAIIREESGGDAVEENLRTLPLLEDEGLELAGAPWAKEGILKHKHHLESVDKKAKDRNWTESFAVIEKGWMRLFSFSMNAKSMRQKAKNQKAAGGVVGGGNWTDSAEALGTFLLRQTIASALPPPGYSKTRPHVWALSLPTGAVHLFQVGTPEIVKEFVTTANYWSARLSKEPLIGGISNVEYGWSDSVINAALLHTENMPPSSTITGPRPSLQSSIRSSVDQGSFRPKLPGDKIIISDWTFPQQSMVASVLLEVDQLKALLAYVKNIEEELQKHTKLRPAMSVAFSPRHPNTTKATANWERKSSYLLREIGKFKIYIDCLQAAQTQKEKIYAEKMPPPSTTTATSASAEGKWKEQEGECTIKDA